MVATELITGMGELVNYIRELEEENKKQQERAETFRVRLCNRSEELVKALSPWKKEHQDHKRILEAIGELKEENKELKEQLAIKEAEQEEEANLICSLKERVEELEADVPPDCCEGCGERFDLQYTLNHADKELREKYDKYMGSEDDDGDLCQICLDSNY